MSTTTEEFTNLIAKLYLLRVVKEERKKLYELKLDEVKSLYEKEQTEYLEADSQMREAEVQVRLVAVREYLETGQKAFPGVQIKIIQEVQYDPAEALEWAIAYKICLNLNVKSFEGLALAGQVMECQVIVNELPQGYIDADLSKFREGAS